MNSIVNSIRFPLSDVSTNMHIIDVLTNNELLGMLVLYMWIGCLYAAMMSSIPMFGPDDEVCNHELAYFLQLW